MRDNDLSASELPVCVWQGLVVSPDHIPKHDFSPGEFCYQLFKSGILYFNFLKPFCLIYFQTSIDFAPAVIAFITDISLLTGFWYGLTMLRHHVNLTQYVDDLPCLKAFANCCHFLFPFFEILIIISQHKWYKNWPQINSPHSPLRVLLLLPLRVARRVNDRFMLVMTKVIGHFGL